MKIIADIDGWRKEINLSEQASEYAHRSGEVEILIARPLHLLCREIVAPPDSCAARVRLFHFGRREGNLPVFEAR